MARPKPLAELIETCLSPAVAKQGFSSTDIVVSWPEIVGERLAAFSQPLRVDWKRKVRDGAAPDPATLVVRVESAFAIELQHLAPIVIERVNAFYGWACIGRLVLKQGPVRRPAPVRIVQTALRPDARAGLDRAIGGLDDPALRAAFDRFGAAVLAAADGEPHRQDGPRVP